MKWEIPLTILMVLCAIVLVSGCTDSSKQYNDERVSFSYPDYWNITNFSNDTNTAVSFKGKDIILAEVTSWKLLPNETIDDYLALSPVDFDPKSTVNGYTFYDGFKADSGTSLVYNQGFFVKDGYVYWIRVHGVSVNSTQGYEMIRDSFKIK